MEIRWRQRRRRIRRWLKPLPRRASIHRYPILNRFADFARRRPYLWSFKDAPLRMYSAGMRIVSSLDTILYIMFTSAEDRSRARCEGEWETHSVLHRHSPLERSRP